MKVVAFLYWNLGFATGVTGVGSKAGGGGNVGVATGTAGTGAMGIGTAGVGAAAPVLLSCLATAPNSSASMSTSKSVVLWPARASTGTKADLSAIWALVEPSVEKTADEM